MIKYLASFYYNTIHEIEIIKKDFERYYFKYVGDADNGAWVPKLNDSSNDWTHHDTWEDAREYLKKRNDEERKKHMHWANSHTNKLNELEKMKNPNLKYIYFSYEYTWIINKKEFTRENENFYFYIDDNGIERSTSKYPPRNYTCRPHKTFQEAQEYLINLRMEKVEQLNKQLEIELSKIELIKNLKDSND